MNQSKDNEISTISKITLLITGISLVVSIFVPLWRIDLDAPQYPEGLYLLIYSYKLAGNVDIINGLPLIAEKLVFGIGKITVALKSI